MTKESLQNYRIAKLEHDQLQHQLEAIENALYYAKAQHVNDMLGSSAVGTPQTPLEIRHIELQEQYRIKLDNLLAEQLAIEKAIEPLEPTARMLMRYRYIDGLKWEEVCTRLKYSWRQTHRLHNKALKKMSEFNMSQRPT